jgi:hypothetical protein
VVVETIPARVEGVEDGDFEAEDGPACEGWLARANMAMHPARGDDDDEGYTPRRGTSYCLKASTGVRCRLSVGLWMDWAECVGCWVGPPWFCSFGALICSFDLRVCSFGVQPLFHQGTPHKSDMLGN